MLFTFYRDAFKWIELEIKASGKATFDYNKKEDRMEDANSPYLLEFNLKFC